MERLARRYVDEGGEADLKACARLLAAAPGQAETDLLLRGIDKALEGRRLEKAPEELEKQLLALRDEAAGRPDAVAAGGAAGRRRRLRTGREAGRRRQGAGRRPHRPDRPARPDRQARLRADAAASAGRREVRRGARRPC